MAETELPRRDPVAVVILDVPPRLGYPNGYSARYFHFLKALAARMRVRVVAVEPVLGFHDTQGRAWQEGFFDDQLKIESKLFVALPPNPLNERSGRGRFRRFVHYVADRLPYFSYPRSIDGSGIQGIVHDADLLVTCLPPMSHLTLLIPDIPSIAVLEDAWEKGLLWEKTRVKPPLRPLVLGGETARIKRLQQLVAERCDALVVISEEERKHLQTQIRSTPIHAFPHAVDCDYFRPSVSTQDFDVAIFGRLQSGLTLEGAIEVLRHSQRSGLLADGRWAFVGQSPPPTLTQFASERVSIAVDVPDVRPFYERTKVVLAPAGFDLPVGYRAGARTTVLQAWAMGKALVATPFVLEGVPAEPGTNVLVAHSPHEMLEAAQRLLADDDLRSRLGIAGRRTVEEKANMKVIASRFVQLCERISGSH